MAAFNIETEICHGRGFANDDTNGFLANFYNWITRTPVDSPVAKVSGGAGWYIVEDASDISATPSNNKYASVYSSTSGVGSGMDTLAECQAITNGSLRVEINSVTEDITGINFSSATSYEDVATILQTAIRAASNGPDDGFEDAEVHHFQKKRSYPSAAYQYLNLRHNFTIIPGEPGMDIAVSSAGVGTDLSSNSYLYLSNSVSAFSNPYIVVSDQSNPGPNDGAKFIYVYMLTSESALVRFKHCMYWDRDCRTNFGTYQESTLGTLDDADFIYDFHGGEECLIISTFVGTTWYHTMVDNWTGNTDLLEGPTITGNLTTELDINGTSFSVGVGEGVNFTPGSFYYLIDLDKSEAVTYVKVDSVVGDVITLDASYFSSKLFKVGSIFAAYHLRYYAWGSHPPSSCCKCGITARGQYGREYGYYDSSNKNSEAELAIPYEAIYNSPDDRELYYVMRPLIGEGVTSYAQTNQFFGVVDNLYFVTKGTMSQMQNGKLINGQNWIYITSSYSIVDGGSGNIAGLIPHWNSAV